MTRQSESRIARVSARKSGSSPASISHAAALRARASSSVTRGAELTRQLGDEVECRRASASARSPGASRPVISQPPGRSSVVRCGQVRPPAAVCRRSPRPSECCSASKENMSSHGRRARASIHCRTCAWFCSTSRSRCCRNSPTTDRARDAARITFRLRGVYPAGRLDFDSEGLLLLTDFGPWQARHQPAALGLREALSASRSKARRTRQALQPLATQACRSADGPTRAVPTPTLIDEPAELWPRNPPIRVRRRSRRAGSSRARAKVAIARCGA